MLNFFTSLVAHNNADKQNQPTFVNKAALGLLTLAMLSAGSAMAAKPELHTAAAQKPVPLAAKAASKDPLAGDTWHADASAGSWPGTLVFDGAKKSVVLAPVGATPMQATYTYTVKPSTNSKVIDGTLRMTNSAKQVSESTFHIDGKTLTLSYAGSPRPEQYVRMTPQEEEAEKARLQKMISEGRIRPLK